MVDITFDTESCIRCGICVRTCAMGHLRMTEDGPAVGKGSCMECFQCAAACPRQAVLFDGSSPVVPAPEDPLEKLVMSRRSVRRFKAEAPNRELIEWALRRACYAPSGKNRREYRWTVVYGRERVQAVRELALRHCRETGEAAELLRFDARGLDLLTCGAPVVIACWSPDECLNPWLDPAIAMETAELLLVSKGLGTCWGGYMRQLAGRCPPLKAGLGIPEGYTMRCCIMAGWPDGPSFPNIPIRPEPDIFWA